MKKQYIILVNALALGTSLIAMESPLNSKIAATSTMVTLNKDQFKRLDRLFEKFAASKDHKNDFSDLEKDFFVKSYQTIHTNLSNIEKFPKSDKQDAIITQLKEYKKKIYQLAIDMMASKTAAKQWLKQADYYSEEERDDASRKDYYIAKRALAIQENRKAELTGLESIITKLKKENEMGKKVVADLQDQLAKAQSALSINENDQAKIAMDLQATKRTIDSTEATAKNKLEIIKGNLVTIVGQTAIAKKELALIESSKETVACDKTARAAQIKAKNAEIATLEMSQVQVQRDIDLLTNKYDAFKKSMWLMTTLFNAYPVDIKTPEPDLSEIAQIKAALEDNSKNTSMDSLDVEEDKEKTE